MEWGHLLTAVLIAGLCLGVGVVSANEAPLPEAGLDQQVRQGATVYLDAGGSVDPDGRIEDYRWRITAPDGTVTTPDCPTCVETQFRADQSGRYEVTVTVTDDDGAARSDTLFVTVAAATPTPTATPTATATPTPTPTPTATPTPTPTMTVTPTPTPDSSGSQTQPASDGTAVELPSIALPGDIISDILNPDTDTATPEPEPATPTPVQTTPSQATGADSPSDTGAEPPSENTSTSNNTSVDDSQPNNSSSESDSTADSPPSTAPSGGGIPADGTGYYEEIERTSRSQGAGHNYYFNFLNDDQVASNKHAGNSGLGADAGGMGVKKDTLENLAEYNPNVTLVDSDYGETTYKISGQVANNFESNEDVHSGTRVGTTDIITEEDLTQENTQAETQNNLKETNSGANSGADSGDNEVAHSRHDSVFNSVDSSSNDTSSTSTDTNSGSDYSYNPDSNQVENSRGQCVGWGC